MNYDEESEAMFFQLLNYEAVQECLNGQNIDQKKLHDFVDLINKKYKENVQQITYEIIEAYSSPQQLQQQRKQRKQDDINKVSIEQANNIKNLIVELKNIVGDLKTKLQQKTIEIPKFTIPDIKQQQQHKQIPKNETITQIKQKIEELRKQIDQNSQDFTNIINNIMVKCSKYHIIVQSKELSKQNTMVETVKKQLFGFYKLQNSCFNKINYIAHKLAAIQSTPQPMSTQQADAFKLRQQLKETQMMLLQSSLSATQRGVDVNIQSNIFKQPQLHNIVNKCDLIQRKLQSVEKKIAKVQPTMITKYTQLFNQFYLEQRTQLQHFTKICTRSIQTLNDRILIVSNQFQNFIQDRIYHKRLSMQIFDSENARFLVKAAFLGQNNYIKRIQEAIYQLDDKVTRQQQRFREVKILMDKKRKKIAYDICSQIIDQFTRKFQGTQSLFTSKYDKLMLKLNTIEENLDKYKKLTLIQKVSQLQKQQIRRDQSDLNVPQIHQGETFKQGVKLIDQIAMSLQQLHIAQIEQIQNHLQNINIQKLDFCNSNIQELNQAFEQRTPISNQIQQKFSKHTTPSPNAQDRIGKQHQNNDNQQYITSPQPKVSLFHDPLDVSDPISIEDLQNTAIQSNIKQKSLKESQRSLQNSKISKRQSFDLDEESSEVQDDDSSQKDEQMDELQIFMSQNIKLFCSQYVVTPEALHKYRVAVFREFIKQKIVNLKLVQWFNNLYNTVGDMFSDQRCQLIASSLRVPYGDVQGYNQALKLYLIKNWNKQIEDSMIKDAVILVQKTIKIPKQISKYNRQNVGNLVQKFFETDDPFSIPISTVIVAFAMFLHLYDYKPQSSTAESPEKTLIQPLMKSTFTTVEQLPLQATIKK